MRRLLLLMLGVLFGTYLMAQNRTITGQVTDASQSPIPGVTVTVTGTNIRTVTNANGNYSISVPSNARSLTFSSVGFAEMVVALGASNTTNAAMAATTSEMTAVVVTGYQNVDRSKYSGAASKVNEKAIRNVPMGSFDQILQGRAPGLTVLSGNGQPGSAANVIIRGQTSIQGTSSPLYVIDGIPVEAGVFQSINPNDIASVDVLKDATSQSLYGSRGAAGVIVVTTKRGKSGKMKLGFSGQYGVKFTPQFGYDVMSTDQLLAAQERLGTVIPNSTLSEWGATTFPVLPGWVYSPNNPNKLVGGVIVPKTAADIASGNAKLDSLRQIKTDWFDEFFQNGTFSNNEISLSGGEGRTRIYSNLGYYKEEGINKPTDMKRITLRTNADYRDDKLTLALSSIVGYTRRNLQMNALNGFNNFINPFGVAQLTPQYVTPTLPNGKYNVGAGFPQFAPTSLDKRAYDKVYNDQAKITLGLNLNYDFTKNIYAGVTAGVDFRETQNTTYNDPRPFNTRTSTNVRTASGSMSEALTRFLQPNARAFVGYKTTFNNVHSIDATVYGEVIRQYSKSITGTAYGIDTLRPNTLAGVTAGNAANQLFQSVTGSRSERALNSVFGTVRYSYSNKYTLNGTYRYDGASNLPEENRFHGFYSVGGVWDIMKENFMSSVKALDVLRLKASYGQSANNDNFPFGDFGYLPLYSTNSSLVSGITGILPSTPGSPNGEWEFTNTLNIGVDFALLRNRVWGDVQVYQKKTNNLFAGLKLCACAGYGNFVQDINAGELSNKGIEFNVNYDVVSKKNLVWTIFTNGGYNKNEVTSLGAASSFERGTELIKVGLPLGSHYEIKWAGVDAATGAPLYYDKDGKITNVYSADNRVQDYGTWVPDFTGGFGTNASFKGFELSVLFNYARNTTRVNNMEFFIQNPGFLQQGLNQDAGYAFWTKPGDVVRVQSPLYQNNFSSRLIQEADWLRLRNVTLGYTVPAKILGKVKHVSEARFYVSGQNLMTWTKWRGLDPEDDNNISGTEYPNPRALTAGLEIKF